jgi:hypothetical protein
MASAHSPESGREPEASLEQALGQTEAEAAAALLAAAAATKAIKGARSAAQLGNLRDLPSALAAAEQAVAALQSQLARTVHSWDFNEETYLSDGSFARELLDTADGMNVRMFEQDERLYCYPALIRILPGERAVLIDRDRERRLRPRVLVARLQAMQRRPPRFKPDAFLETLHKAYTVLVARHGKDARGRGVAEPLVDVYQLLTLLPGQGREYSRQEFARDIYLLDRSDATATRTGQVISLPASTGTRSSGVIRVITESGEEKTYYAIAFTGDK